MSWERSVRKAEPSQEYKRILEEGPYLFFVNAMQRKGRALCKGPPVDGSVAERSPPRMASWLTGRRCWDRDPAEVGFPEGHTQQSPRLHPQPQPVHRIQG